MRRTLLVAALAAAGWSAPASASGPTAATPAAPFGYLSGFEYGQQWVDALEPHLEDRQLRKLRKLKVRISPDPLPPGHQCRGPGQVGFIVPEGRLATITLCLRNLLYLAAFGGEVSYSRLLSRRDDWEESVYAYAQLYGEASRKHLDEPLPADWSRWVPCHFLEYLMLKSTGGDLAACESGPLDPARLRSWIASEPAALDLEAIVAAARERGVEPENWVRTLGDASGRTLFEHLLLFTVFHEVGHVLLGHLATFPEGCAAVRQERAADEFADRLLARTTPAPAKSFAVSPEDALRQARYGWLLYQLGLRQSHSTDVTRDGLLEARVTATLLAFLDQLERGLQRDEWAFGSAGEDQDVLADQLRNRIAQARLCTAGERRRTPRHPS